MLTVFQFFQMGSLEKAASYFKQVEEIEGDASCRINVNRWVKVVSTFDFNWSTISCLTYRILLVHILIIMRENPEFFQENPPPTVHVREKSEMKLIENWIRIVQII